MNRIRLVAIDLDGTLIPRELTLSPVVKTALERARARGVATTVVTGRMFAAARPWAEAVGVDGPIVCYQGAAIYNVAGGERVFHVPLEIETGRRVFALAKADGLRVLGFLDDKLFVETMDDYVRHYEGLSQVAANVVPSLHELFENNASTKVVCVTDRERAPGYVETLRALVGSEGYVTRSIPEYIEVLNSRVNKGVALAAVAERYGVSLGETMAIGDSWNDEPLLRAAGFGVAMGSAPPELLAVADAVVADVYHDGIAEALERFVFAEPERRAAL